MRPSRFALAASLLSLSALLLWLNLREKDYYEGGSLVPPPDDHVPADDGLLRQILPVPFPHHCPVRGECLHPVEILGNRRILSLRDHDGWYRLFWAADEIYYFEDPALLAACLRNSTARDPRGTWNIRARLGGSVPAGAGNSSCILEPSEIDLTYRLEVGPEPAAGVAEEGPVPRTLEWFSFFPARRHLPFLLHFRWQREAPPSPPVWRCSCGTD